MHMNELVLRPPYTGWGGSEANRPAKAAELPSGGCRAHALGRQPTITPLGQRSRVAGLPRLSTATSMSAEETVVLADARVGIAGLGLNPREARPRPDAVRSAESPSRVEGSVRRLGGASPRPSYQEARRARARPLPLCLPPSAHSPGGASRPPPPSRPLRLPAAAGALSG